MITSLKNLYLYPITLILLYGNLVDARIDMTIHGGLKRLDGATIHIPNEGLKANWENHIWILGADVIYRLPLNMGIGLRYQHLLSSGQYTPAQGTEALSQKFHFNTNRVSLLVNYKFINDMEPGMFFAGVLIAIDIFKTFYFDMPETDSSSSIDKIMTNQSLFWQKVSGQAGLEIGFRWAYLFMKAEVGYSLLSFNGLKCESQTNGCGTHSSEDIFNFNAFYAVLGIGYSFK